jgi:hypothetical protein
MHIGKRVIAAVLGIAALLAVPWAAAQTTGEKEEFTAIAIANNDQVTGAGTVQIRIERWSTEAEQKRLVDTLIKDGPQKMLTLLQDMRPVGTIRTPDSLGYNLRYAQQARGKDGGRQIVIATDRPIGFWEARNQPRTIDYPFTVIQMQMGPDGKGKGTLSYATKIIAYNKIIELENYATAPIMLTEITSRKIRD